MPALLSISADGAAPRSIGEYRAEAHEALSAPLYTLALPLLGVAFIVSAGFSAPRLRRADRTRGGRGTRAQDWRDRAAPHQAAEDAPDRAVGGGEALRAYERPDFRPPPHEALDEFDGGSISLLQIDSLHTYEAVAHDFQSWLPKVKNGRVILLHEVVERKETFGAHGLWREITDGRPSFTFLHGHGLGVLGIGDGFPRPVQALFDAAQDPGSTSRIRAAYHRLGTAVELEARGRREDAQLLQARAKAADLEEGLEAAKKQAEAWAWSSAQISARSAADAANATISAMAGEVLWLRRKSESAGWHPVLPCYLRMAKGDNAISVLSQWQFHNRPGYSCVRQQIG